MARIKGKEMTVCTDIVYSDGKNWYMNCSNVLTLNIGKVIRKDKMYNETVEILHKIEVLLGDLDLYERNQLDHLLFEFYEESYEKGFKDGEDVGFDKGRELKRLAINTV